MNHAAAPRRAPQGHQPRRRADDPAGEPAAVFDVDGTLVDTSRSFDAAVSEIVLARSGTPLAPSELRALRAEGGWNDDWDAAAELLRRRGVAAPRDAVEEEGVAAYLRIARQAERLLVQPDVLARLSEQFRLFVLTGRTRREFDPLWRDALGPLFEGIYCRDDLPDLPAKPAPDMLVEMMRRHGFSRGCYVGDSVDDMRASAAAGLVPIGVAGTVPVEALLGAGAVVVLSSVSEIEGALARARWTVGRPAGPARSSNGAAART